MPSDEKFLPTSPDQDRAQREYAGLQHIAKRHGSTAELRARQAHSETLEPYGATRIVAGLAAGGLFAESDEAEVDGTDLMAALTLIPKVRSELDELEAALLLAARHSGITWQHIAYGLGVGSAQAARQRYERLVRRTSAEDGSAAR